MFGKRALRRLFPLFLFCAPIVVAGNDWTVRDIELAPYEGAFAEFCVAVPGGGTLDIELAAAKSIDFNVHFHTDTDTFYAVRERVGREASFTVTAEVTQRYCLTWTNPESRLETTQVRTRFRVR